MIPFDGAGSDDRGRVTPTALATFCRGLPGPYAKVLSDSLRPRPRRDARQRPADSPAAGKVQMKTGNRVVGTTADQIIVLGNSLAGYIEAKTGRQLTFMVGVSNVPIATPAEFEQSRGPGGMVAAIQQAF